MLVVSAPDEALRRAAQADFTAQSVKLKAAEQELRDFCKQTGFLPDTSRVWVNGFGRSVSQRAVHANKKALTSGAKSGIINKKVSDRIINLFNEGEYGLFDYQEIENELLSSFIGREIAKFIEYENYTINMNYDIDSPIDLMGDVLGNDITVYAVNHDSTQQVAETIIHEAAHKKYNWDLDQEGEVNCRLLEFFHTHSESTEEKIHEIVDFVRQEYGYLPEGDLYGY